MNQKDLCSVWKTAEPKCLTQPAIGSASTQHVNDWLNPTACDRLSPTSVVRRSSLATCGSTCYLIFALESPSGSNPFAVLRSQPEFPTTPSCSSGLLPVTVSTPALPTITWEKWSYTMQAVCIMIFVKKDSPGGQSIPEHGVV